jgi:hypothetical protein
MFRSSAGRLSMGGLSSELLSRVRSGAELSNVCSSGTVQSRLLSAVHGCSVSSSANAELKVTKSILGTVPVLSNIVSVEPVGLPIPCVVNIAGLSFRSINPLFIITSSSPSSAARCRFFGRPICFCNEYMHVMFSRRHLEHVGCPPEHLSFFDPTVT